MKANALRISCPTGLPREAPSAAIVAAFRKASKRWIEPLRKISGMSLDAVLCTGANDIHVKQPPYVCACGKANENKSDRTPCDATHDQLRSRALARGQPEQTICPSGCILFAIPVIADGKALGFIEGGGKFSDTPRSETPGCPPVELTGLIELLQSVSASISKEAGEVLFCSDDGDPPAVAHAKELVKMHYTAKLGIAGVAREVSLSEDHFSRLFKRATGLTFTEYVGRVRVDHARHILSATGKQIAEVAFECGFESIPHFNRLFKRYAGVAPKVYRSASRAEVGSD